MKTKFLFLIGLSALLFQCSTEEDVTKKSPLWGVEFSEESTATLSRAPWINKTQDQK